MKTLFKHLFFAMAMSVWLVGCASKPSDAAAKSTPTKYIYLPSETGSRISRRVAVNPDGSVSPEPSSVIKANPEAGQEMLRKGNVGGKSN